MTSQPKTSSTASVSRPQASCRDGERSSRSTLLTSSGNSRTRRYVSVTRFSPSCLETGRRCVPDALRAASQAVRPLSTTRRHRNTFLTPILRHVARGTHSGLAVHSVQTFRKCHPFHPPSYLLSASTTLVSQNGPEGMEESENMTTIIMRASDDARLWSFLALFQCFPILGKLPISLVFAEAPTGIQE